MYIFYKFNSMKERHSSGIHISLFNQRQQFQWGGKNIWKKFCVDADINLMIYFNHFNTDFHWIIVKLTSLTFLHVYDLIFLCNYALVCPQT